MGQDYLNRVAQTGLLDDDVQQGSFKELLLPAARLSGLLTELTADPAWPMLVGHILEDQDHMNRMINGHANVPQGPP